VTIGLLLMLVLVTTAKTDCRGTRTRALAAKLVNNTVVGITQRKKGLFVHIIIRFILIKTHTQSTVVLMSKEIEC